LSHRGDWVLEKDKTEPGNKKGTTSHEKTYENKKTGEILHTHEIKNDKTGKSTHQEHPRDYSKAKDDDEKPSKSDDSNDTE
jgi:hypothetical protein